jgi:hypothetical protein
MAEKRMLSKVISVSKKVNLRLTNHFSRLFYTWLIPHTDDFGRLTGCPHKLRALIIPMLSETHEDVEKALMELNNVDLIKWYEVNGEQYLQVMNFEEHQQGLHKRTKSKIPDPPDFSRKFPEIPSELNRTEQNGTEGNRTERNGTAPPVPTFDGSFKDEILSLLKKYNVECKGISQLEDICSYYGRVDMEVIELCIKKSENQHVPYAISIIERHIKEKKTTKESIFNKGALPLERNEQGSTGIHGKSATPLTDLYAISS